MCVVNIGSKAGRKNEGSTKAGSCAPSAERADLGSYLANLISQLHSHVWHTRSTLAGDGC